MKIIVFVLVLLISGTILGQLNQTKYYLKKKQEILYGECNIDGFKQGEFAGWFLNEYKNYNVTDTLINDISEISLDSIYVFLGTWCSDTKRELPHFCKILNYDCFSKVKVRYFAFDGNKNNDVIDTEEFNIHYLPTFVFYYNGDELGRIIETPVISLEEDIMNLLIKLSD